MRRPSAQLIVAFLISLIVGYGLSYLTMLFLQITLRVYGATIWIVAILYATLLIFILDKPLRLKVFEWPEPREETVKDVDKPTFSAVIWDYMTTVDHKKIGLMYLMTAGVFFIIGGFEALAMRIQLIVPNGTFLAPDQYNQILTMHGTTMVFLVAMPILSGLANYVAVLQVGARDMAFPRLNALSIWLLIFGGLLMHLSFLFGGPADGGWFSYVPLTSKNYSPTTGVDYWIMSLTILGVSSIATAINLIVTLLRMRAPGLTLNRLSIFVWTMLVQSFLVLFAFPSFTVAAILLFLDRLIGTTFYSANAGGDPLLWQHLFWFFGHPEVYIMILPAMGIVSEVLPVFSRKPIFGYTAIVYSTVAIGFLGFTVWAHHMFAVGMGTVAVSAFSATSMFIAIPTAIKIFNWIGTIWGGAVRPRVAFLFAAGFVGMFVIGGLSGVMLAIVPINFQVTDTYFVVAHLHYVLFGGTMFGVFAGLYYWFPKMTGKLLHEGLGKIHFWLLLLGFNLTFFPMHNAGLNGMPRRIYTYPDGQGWEVSNLVSTLGAFVMGIAILTFMINLYLSLRKERDAGDNPWEAWTLEWATTSPPPPHNFDALPPVNSRRPLWNLLHPEQPDRPAHRLPRSLRRADRESLPTEKPAIHLPPPSYWPIVLAAGLTLTLAGLIYIPFGLMITIPGLVIFAVAITNWIREPVH